MDIKETLRNLLQEVVMPDLSRVKEENGKILVILELTNKRLDDVNAHLADQSRRIDEVRSELTGRIDELSSELTGRIDGIRSELTGRIDETNKRMDDIHRDLVNRLDANNSRIDRFFETSVSKKELEAVESRVKRMENDFNALRQKVAA